MDRVKKRVAIKRYIKHCEYCDREYSASRLHSRTCSDACREKLWKAGFSNKKVMTLVAMFPTSAELKEYLKIAPEGKYNFCIEKSGQCYAYRYTDEWINSQGKNNKWHCRAGVMARCKDIPALLESNRDQ
jgi:predicted nucleic acid-binding Zn ribbon protein